MMMGARCDDYDVNGGVWLLRLLPLESDFEKHEKPRPTGDDRDLVRHGGLDSIVPSFSIVSLNLSRESCMYYSARWLTDCLLRVSDSIHTVSIVHKIVLRDHKKSINSLKHHQVSCDDASLQMVDYLCCDRLSAMDVFWEIEAAITLFD